MEIFRQWDTLYSGTPFIDALCTRPHLFRMLRKRFLHRSDVHKMVVYRIPETNCFFVDRMYVDQVVDRLSYAGKEVEFRIYAYTLAGVSLQLGCDCECDMIETRK